MSKKTFTFGKTRELSKRLKLSKLSKPNSLTSGQLEFDNLHFFIYSEASFATKNKLSLKIRYILLMSNKSDNCHIPDYSSKKSKLVVGSIIVPRTDIVMDLFDTFHTLKSYLKLMHGRILHLYMYTDSRQLFSGIFNDKQTYYIEAFEWWNIRGKRGVKYLKWTVSDWSQGSIIQLIHSVRLAGTSQYIRSWMEKIAPKLWYRSYAALYSKKRALSVRRINL